ncbi:MAG: hypothetical protein Q4C30_00400 [Bacteroidia bacterium]|nr:hypothetical protein [Bacteroidia bacterium]
MTLAALFIAADIAMIALWGYFAYTKRPHISLRAMFMIIAGIVTIMVECFPNTDIGIASSYFLLTAGLIHYLSNRKGKNDILFIVTYIASVIPVSILPYVIEDSPYEKMVKSFKYKDVKTLANLIDVSILPSFELDTLYIDDNISDPKLITAKFVYKADFDKKSYLENVELMKQMYPRHIHSTQINQNREMYFASEVTNGAECRTFSSAAIDLYDTGFSVTYGEYNDRVDPVHIGYLSQVFGDIPEHTSIFRRNVHSWVKVDGEEIILLETPLYSEDIERLKIVCTREPLWSVESSNDTFILKYTNIINNKTTHTVTYTMTPDQYGGCESIHVRSIRESR